MASIEEVIRQIRMRLEVETGQNPFDVDEVIVLPILSSLGWDAANPKQVLLKMLGEQEEYLTLHSQGRLRTLITRTQSRHGMAEGVPRLLRDAAMSGARLAVITNGFDWWFFLPTDAKWPLAPVKVTDLMLRDSVLVRKVLREFLTRSGDIYADSSLTNLASPGHTGRPGLVVSGLCPAPYSKPLAVVLDGERLGVKYWNDVLITTAEWLLSKGRVLPYDRKIKGSRWIIVSYDIDQIKQRPHRLSNDAYIETDYSGTDCVYWAQWLMQTAGFRGSRFSVQYIEPS